MPLFSIVVPVYKAETYLRECVDSVINQSFTDWELILVDDVSPDASPRIMNEYAAKDSRIKSIHLDRYCCAAAARNAGIHASIGEYFVFLDSDDFINDGSLSAIADTVTKNPDADVIFLSFHFYRMSEKRTYRHIVPDMKGLAGLSNDEFLLKIVHDGCCIPQPGTKLVKSSFLKSNEHIFQKGVFVCEDADWTYKILSKPGVYSACDYPHYMYRIRKGSLSTSRNGLRPWAESANKIMANWAPYFSDKNAPNREANLCLLARNYAVTLALWRALSEESKEKYKKTLQKYSWILYHSNDYKTIITRTAYKILGFNISSKMLFEYMRFAQWRAHE